MKPFRSIIIEGIDRVGKNTLIDGLINELGYHEVVHYQKPKLLKVYEQQTLEDAKRIQVTDVKRETLRKYQHASFTSMLHLLSSRANIIFNRAHLGEYVYAPMYRGYDGSYVFDLEDHFIHDLGSDFHETTLLVLLHSSDLSFITEDGHSLGGLEKREAEIVAFLKAFERSRIQHKLALDVSDSRGKFVPATKLLETVLQAYRQSQSWNEKTWHVSWTYDDPYAPGQLQRVGNLVGDVNKAVK